MHAAVRSDIPDIEVFDAMSEYSKGMLVSYWRHRDRMDAWENQVATEEAERKSKAK